MQRFSLQPLLSVLLSAAVLLACAACGGHGHKSSSSGSSSSSSGSDSPSIAPAYDVTGTWNTTLESVPLGTTTFSMTPSGVLSGWLRTETGESGDISGQMSGSDAEYTVSFKAKTYLVTIGFGSSSKATGTLVDAGGHVHSMSLSR